MLNKDGTTNSIYLDDFGTGYSALSYMHDLDVDFIKIDGSFIKKINRRNDENIITDCLIELAKKISKNISALGNSMIF